MEHVYSSIDFGSDTIKIVVCELYKNRLNLLAASSTKAKGIKRGLITDPKEAIESIENAFAEIESMLGTEIKKIIATIPSYNAEYKIIKGKTKVEGDIITNKDMRKAYKEAVKDSLKPGYEIVTLMPIDFKINGKTIMKDPKDFPGETLEGRAMSITVPKKNLYSVVSILESLGKEVVDISLTSVSDMHTYRDKQIDSEICSIINIGSQTTTINLYNKAIPVNTKILPMGGNDIDNDIAYMYKISKKEAKKIKEKFALATKRGANIKDIYETTDLDGNKIKINQLEVSEIVMYRVEEILSLAKKEINLLTNRKIKYIMFTGGTSNLINFELMAQDIFGINATARKINLVGARNPKYSVAVGNIIYFIGNLKLKGEDYTMLSQRDMEILSSPSKHFVGTDGNTMLGKVFGYFFGE